MNLMADAINRPNGPPDDRAVLFYLMGIFAASGELDGLSSKDCKDLHDALELRFSDSPEGDSNAGR